MTDLADKLKDRIAQQGPISVADYMQACLTEYYGQGDVFGQDGDFTTAPEISQVFGELIGLWFAVVWQSMGSPTQVRLVEIGPGRGTLMSDLLRAASGVPAFRAAVDVHLVETSPALRDIQRQTLGDIPVTWHDTIQSLPDGPILLVANELFDALPIEQFEKTSEGWHARHIDSDDNGLRFMIGDPVEHSLEAPTGAIAEACPMGRALARSIAERLSAQGGAALIFDYGYLRSAAGDTLQALKHHEFSPVLETPGAADLTAHVDFQALAEAATEGGAHINGPTYQGSFLRRLGIEMRAANLAKKASPEQAEHLTSGCRRLIHPDGMGTLFKVLGLSAPDLPPLPGFEDEHDHS